MGWARSLDKFSSEWNRPIEWMVENILFHLEEKKIIIIILHPSCLKINHCSIDLRSYVSLEGERAYAVFVSLLRRVSPSWGGGEEPALILAFSLPMPQDKFPIGHDWCFSHKHFSLIVHGLISLHIRFGEAGGIWEGAAVSRYHLRSLNGLLHIFSLTFPSGFFALWCVCCNRSDAATESAWVRVPLPFLVYGCSVHGWFRMRSIQNNRWGGKGLLQFFLRLFCACMVDLNWGILIDGEG